MKSIAGRALLVATATCLGLASTGCSLVFSHGPNVAPATMTADTQVRCSGSVALPVVDTALVGTHLISVLWASKQPDETFGSSSGRTAVIAADLGLATLHLVSAVYGYYNASSCHDAKAREIELDRAKYPPQGEEEQARARARAVLVIHRRDAFWSNWLPGHEGTACPDAQTLLTGDAECSGVACGAPLLLAIGYQKSCALDADAQSSLRGLRRRWLGAAATMVSSCLEETFTAIEDESRARTLPERCPGEGLTEAAFRDSVRRRLAPAAPQDPVKAK
jgi:hypothetical protein